MALQTQRHTHRQIIMSTVHVQLYFLEVAQY